MPRHIDPRRHDRGSAIIVAIILTLVLGVVGLALVKRTNTEIDAISSKRHHDRMVSCAEAGREMILSQFRVFGVNTTNMSLNATMGGMQVQGGHYDAVNVGTVTSVPGAGQGGGMGMSDLANRMAGAGGFQGLTGSNAYRISVICTDTSTQHAQEIEFDLRWGL